MKPTELTSRARAARRSSRQRGQAVVELAMTLPLMLLIGLLVSEGAGILHAHQVLNNAAREAAHLSAMPDNKCNPNASGSISYAQCLQNMRQAAVDYAHSNGIPGVA